MLANCAEMKELRVEVQEVTARLERVEREQKRQGRRLERIEGLGQTMRADVDELQDRGAELESKQA